MDTKNLKATEEVEDEENVENAQQNEDFEDDAYLMQLHRRFMDMKKDRKNA